MRIGVFGGSFDPVHIGHLIVAECCREQAGLERVLFLPASVPPHKQDRRMAPGPLRLEMLELAIAGHEGFAVCDEEIARGGVSYTVDTLEALLMRRPDDEHLLLLGVDALAGLPTWRLPKRILELVRLLVVERAGVDDLARVLATPELGSLLGAAGLDQVMRERVVCPAIGVRSSDLRAAVVSGRSIRYRTPRAVECLIQAQRLYQET
jgi:nicotinate-nucleotide adenylyltransferase